MVLTFLTGVLYPLLVTAISNAVFFEKAAGSLVRSGENFVGSELIGQKFESPRYFHSRPSAVEYNPLPSGGSNLGLTSADLKKIVDERTAKLTADNPGAGSPPADLLFASGSGLDPHISVAAADFQTARVARVRVLDVSAVHKIVNDLTERRQFDMLGEPRVNVLRLNLAIDELDRR